MRAACAICVRHLRTPSARDDGASEQLTARLEEAVRVSYEKKTGERLPHPYTLRRVPLTEALLALTRSGAGVAIVDRWLVEPHLDRKLIAVPLQPRAARKFYAIFRKRNPRALPIDALVKVIAAEATKHTRD